MVGQPIGRAVLEHDRRVEREAELAVDGVDETDAEDRIDAVVGQRRARADLGDRQLQGGAERRDDEVAEAGPVGRLGWLDRCHHRIAPTRRYCRLNGRPLGQQHAVGHRADHVMTAFSRVTRQELDRLEACLLQHLLPGPRAQQRRAGNAQVIVVVQPPAIEQAKGQRAVETVLRDLVDQQDAALLQCALGMAQRCADVPRGMQHIGGDRDVVGADGDVLGLGVALDVPELRPEIGMVAAPTRVGFQEKRARDIGEQVLFDVAPLPEMSQDGACGAAGAGADLDHAQPGVGLGRHAVVQERAGGFSDHAIEEIEQRIAAVDPLDLLARSAGEQDFRGRHLAPQDPRQSGEAAIEQIDLGLPAEIVAAAIAETLPLCLDVVWDLDRAVPGQGRFGLRQPLRVFRCNAGLDARVTDRLVEQPHHPRVELGRLAVSAQLNQFAGSRGGSRRHAGHSRPRRQPDVIVGSCHQPPHQR